jgi:succinate dehydrogenase/fumarate reductase flavoprotein subunit
MKARREATEACRESKETTSLAIESVAVHEEVPKEEAALEPVRALRERHGDRNLAVGRRRLQKKRNQGNGVSRKELLAGCRGMNRRAIPARRKGHCHQGQGKNKAVRRTQKRQTFEKGRRPKPEGSTGLRDQDLKEQLCLRS